MTCILFGTLLVMLLTLVSHTHSVKILECREDCQKSFCKLKKENGLFSGQSNVDVCNMDYQHHHRMRREVDLPWYNHSGDKLSDNINHGKQKDTQSAHQAKKKGK
uniref:Uncharacterized protein n=1 Tax=Cacopsylla melanoneura TaxID=428564 RepID=A0A8D9EB50_9HEMI